MPRLDKVRIQKLTNVAPGTELSFGSKGVVLLGKNGSGKTTLLNAIVAMCRCDFAGLGGDDFDVSFEMTHGEISISTRMQRSSDRRSGAADPSALEQDLRIYALPDSSHLELTIEIADASHSVKIASSSRGSVYTFSDGASHETNASPIMGWTVVYGIPRSAGKQTFAKGLIKTILALHLLDISLRRFDEGLGYFELLTTKSEHGFRIDYNETQNEDIESNYFSSAFSSRLTSLGIIQSMLINFDSNDREHSFAFASNESFPLLKKFCELTDFTKATAMADLEERKKSGDQEKFVFRPLHFFLTLGDAGIHHDQLSFGQKRLLAFLYYLATNPSIIVADELVNGMHYDWIKDCVQRLESRQSFLSSQNPLLFDYMNFESVEDVAAQFVECSVDTNHLFVWRNMPMKDAEVFFELYQAGIQHVSEILRTRGYW